MLHLPLVALLAVDPAPAEPQAAPTPAPAEQPAPVEQPAPTAQPPAAPGWGHPHGWSWHRWDRPEEPTPSGPRISFEGGWVPFSGGYLFQANVKTMRGWSAGLGFFGTRDNAGRFDEGWSLGVRQGYELHVFRTFRARPWGGPFVGAQVRLQQWVLGNQGSGDVLEPWVVTAVPEVGIQWFPFRRSFFLRPWLGGEILVASRSALTAGDQTYQPRVVTPTGGVNAGFEF